MEFYDTRVERRGGVVLHRTRVRFAHDKLPGAEVTFEIPARWSHWVDGGPAVLVPIGLVLAARLGDDLRVEAPLDADLRAACLAAIDLQCRWFGWRVPDLIAPYAVDRRPRRHPTRGLFFTRGVDSWGTLLALDAAPAKERITHLLTIDADTHLTDEARRQVLDATRQVVNELKMPFVAIRTDVRALFDRYTRWDYETHGAVLAGIGYLLRNGLGGVVVGATNPWHDAVPWGSHPMLDPLWTTPHLDVRHFGADEPRWERVERIVADPRVTSTLQVCWKGGTEGNCGVCAKCLLTMSSLHLSGHHGWEDRFGAPFEPDRIAETGTSSPLLTNAAIDHCDAAGLEADVIRQHWERVPRNPESIYVYRNTARQQRVPVQAPDGGTVDADTRLALGRLLAPLGLRVDHLGHELADQGALVISAGTGPDGGLSLAVGAPGIDLTPVLSADDLVGLLAAIGCEPDRSVAFDPDGQPPDVAGWKARRLRNAAEAPATGGAVTEARVDRTGDPVCRDARPAEVDAR